MDSVNHDFQIFHCCKCLRFREEEVWSDDYCFSLGLIDSSGLRFHYTKQLRKYESGVLLVGADVNRAMLIPPRQKNWKINSFCSSDCTQKVLPSTFICSSTQFGADSACFYIQIIAFIIAWLPRARRARGTEPHTHGIGQLHDDDI